MINIIMKLDKTTKNTYRYAEEAKGKPPMIGTLYIQKWAFETEAPTTIVVQVEKSQ